MRTSRFPLYPIDKSYCFNLCVVLFACLFLSTCSKDKGCGFEKDIADCILELFPAKEKVLTLKDLDENIIPFEFAREKTEDYEVNFDFNDDCYQYQKTSFVLASTVEYEIIFKTDSRPQEQFFSITFFDHSNNSESLFVIPTHSDCKYKAPDIEEAMEEGSPRIIDLVWIGDLVFEEVIRLENQNLYNDSDLDDNGMFKFLFLTNDFKIIRLESTTELWEITL